MVKETEYLGSTACLSLGQQGKVQVFLCQDFSSTNAAPRRACNTDAQI